MILIMSSNQTLTLLVPCYNEELRIPETLEFLTKWKESNQNINTEIMIVNDGSTDQTEKIIKESPKFTELNVPKLGHSEE